ncbi:MAG: signal recognition particle protein [Gemmatimonadetes bacterium]|nr:signal recognition particle protein [Gemmatimonadota bacterium]
MFEDLSEKLETAFRGLRSRGVLDEAAISEGLREIRRALLEADVNYQVARDFLARVEERAKGQQVLRSVSPGQQVVKIVHDELVELLGSRARGLDLGSRKPAVVMLVGLQGSGKTTTAAKLAQRLKREGRTPLLVAADVYRPAAVEQLRTLGSQVGIPVHAEPGETDVPGIVERGVEAARKGGRGVVILDTAGRLHVDPQMMEELRVVHERVRPDEVLLVADGMTGQDAVNVASSFDADVALTGVILTKMDGDARGGAALSIRAVTGKPIKFLGTSERLDGLELFHPDRLAGRILQMGDVLTLVERAQATVDEGDAKALEEKLRRKGDLDLEDFLRSLKQLQRLGPLESILKMLPGVNTRALKDFKVDSRRLKQTQAIVLSMTPQERRTPRILNGSRRKRIALGSGTSVADVNRLLKQFTQMNKVLKGLRGGGGGRGRGMPFGASLPR